MECLGGGGSRNQRSSKETLTFRRFQIKYIGILRMHCLPKQMNNFHANQIKNLNVKFNKISRSHFTRILDF